VTVGHRIGTVSDLRRSSRCLDRRLASVGEVLGAIKKGALHFQYENNRPLWALSDGRIVAVDVAALVIGNASVAPVGGALFEDLPGQTWRYVP
jgi:hypothetical protein